MNYLYTALIVVVCIFIGYKFLKKNADKVTDFFWNAWKAYVFHGDEGAREAASLTLAVAVDNQRKSMVVAYEAFKTKLLASGALTEDPTMKLNAENITVRFEKLSADFKVLANSSISVTSITAMKAEFKREHPEAEKALAKFDSDFYLRKYPDINF